jgi:signal transduction histidine kinase
MKFPMSIALYNDWKKENSFPTESFSASYIKPLNQQFIAGYDIISDVRSNPLFVVWATIPRTIYNQGLSTVSYIDQALFVTGFVFSVIIITILEFSVLRRLSTLANSVIKLGKHGDALCELRVSGNDEITWLTLSINGLLQEIQSQTLSLKRSERLSAIGELARQVGHDLRNPLTSTKYASYYLKQKGHKCTDEDRERMLGVIEKDVERSDKIITELIEYSSDMCLETEESCPRWLLQGALKNVSIPRSVTVLDGTSQQPKMIVDAVKVQRAFASIIKNAVEAMPKGGTLTIRSVQEGSAVKIAFTDSGVGIADELLPKVFSPLLTTKARGMGFSLAICKRIVESHGGEVSVQSVVGKGTTFNLTLPLKPTMPQEAVEAAFSKRDPLLHYEVNGYGGGG